MRLIDFSEIIIGQNPVRIRRRNLDFKFGQRRNHLPVVILTINAPCSIQRIQSLRTGFYRLLVKLHCKILTVQFQLLNLTNDMENTALLLRIGFLGLNLKEYIHKRLPFCQMRIGLIQPQEISPFSIIAVNRRKALKCCSVIRRLLQGLLISSNLLFHIVLNANVKN